MKSPPENETEPAPVPKSTRTKLRRWGLGLLGFLALTGVALWIAREPIAARIEATVIRDLNKNGIYPHYAARSWLPWRGLRFEKVVLFRDAAGTQPVIEISALAVDFPWLEFLRGKGLVTRWRTREATLTVHDNAGVLVFQHFTTKVVVRDGRLDVERLRFRTEAISWAVTGRIIPPAGPTTPAAGGNFAVDLSWFRDGVAAIGIKPGTGPFFIQGTFAVDLHQPDVHWQAVLQGNGRNVESHGVPLHDAAVNGQLSEANLKLSSTLQFAQGSAKLSVSRADWDRAPLLISGQIADAHGVADDVAASFDFAGPSMVISNLRGKAELLAFLHNFPFLVPFLPHGLRVLTAPDIQVQGLVWSGKGGGPAFSGGSVRLQSPADLIVSIAGQVVTVNHLMGEATFKDRGWQLTAETGPASYRGVVVPSTKWEADWESPRLKVVSHLALAKGAGDLTFSSENWPRATLALEGSIVDTAKREDHFSGSYDGDHHSVAISKLSGPANLVELLSNFPELASHLPKRLEIRVFPDLLVKEFSYRFDKASDNWSVEAIQLTSGAELTTTVKEHPLPISQLKGAASFNGHAWRLSDVSGQMLGGRFAVTGSNEEGVLREATISVGNIQMKQLDALLRESDSAFGEALLSFDYRGAVGAKPEQLTGSGTARMENAPFVRVPLLDATYALFFAFTPGVKRADVGRVNATFSASKGVVTVSQLSAEGGSISVSAKGTVDLVQRKVSAHATGNLRGVVGLATSPISQALEMEVSGPLDQIRVRPAGPIGIVSSGVSGAAKAAGGVLKEGVTLPLKVLDWFKSGNATPKPTR